MPPLPLLPNQPAGVPDWTPPAPGTAAAAPTMPPGVMPASYYDAVMEAAKKAYVESAGQENTYRTRALEEQYKSAAAARENAMKIAQLQARTSRYGTDVQSQTAMRQLVENARQFDARHGLDIAEAYTKFASTPDMMFSRLDLMSALGRVGQGLSPSPITSQPSQPRAKTWQDFAALSGYGQGGGAGSAATSGGGGSQTDPRLTAANAVMKAMPPSESMGADDQDWEALSAIKALYSASAPGSLERLGPARRKIAQAGMGRLGYDVNALEDEYGRTRPGQMSARLA